MASYYATNNNEFTNFAVPHGGIFPGGFGNRIIPTWLSTDTRDTLRPPLELQGYAAVLEALGFNQVLFTTSDTTMQFLKMKSGV